MGIQAPAEVKFNLIDKALMQDGSLLDVSNLCKLAGVSRSGYYNWINSADRRAQYEKNDAKDFELILKAYQFRGYAKGARGIYMRLLHEGIQMNRKKIRRLMRKYNLVCPIRKRSPYKAMMRAIKTSHVAENKVNREFTKHGARKILLTDITYLFFWGGGCCYLSTILDAYTHEILAYRLSESLEVEFVLDTVDKLVKRYGCSLDDETIVHSDQGIHYTSNAFIQKLKCEGFVQSMSRRGNCWDNAPQESFFGHMKDEIMYYVEKCNTFEEVKVRVDDWMDYYNNDRYQMDLLKLSPTEYYKYLITGIYPLEKFFNKPSRDSAPKHESATRGD